MTTLREKRYRVDVPLEDEPGAPEPRRCGRCGRYKAQHNMVDGPRGWRCSTPVSVSECNFDSQGRAEPQPNEWDRHDDEQHRARAERHELDVAAGFGVGGNRR